MTTFSELTPSQLEQRERPKILDQIAGHSIMGLAARAGGGPFYAYDVRQIKKRIEELRELMPEGVQLFYSPKVNPSQPLLHEMAEMVDGFDLASAKELRSALNTRVAADRCLLTGPAKGDADIDIALAAGSIINLESSAQLACALARGSKTGRTPRLSFRINPYEFVSHIGLGRYDKSPFGFDPSELPNALDDACANGAKIEGFHGFFGSQFYDIGEIGRIQKALFALSEKLANHIGLDRYFINLGGGFPVPFYEGEPEFDLAGMASQMNDWLRNRLPQDGRVTVILELGRYLVSEAGFYVAKVVDCKSIADERFVVLDGGLNHNSLAAGVFGRSDAPNAKVAICGENVGERPLQTVSIVGPLCTAVDRFASRISLPQPKIGDYIVVRNAGAYGPSFSPAGFLSHASAEELLVHSID